MASAQERVKLGAHFVEQYRPGWANQINLETFDIRHPDQCILGQLDGDYSLGLNRLVKAVPQAMHFAGSQMGFDTRPLTRFEYFIRYDDRRALEKAWVREVTRRQKQSVVAA